MANAAKVILTLIVLVASLGGSILGLVANEPMTLFGKLLIAGSIMFMGRCWWRLDGRAGDQAKQIR